jgi:HPt (histidine-containing phosphotransfer) domain-containing protein
MNQPQPNPGAPIRSEYATDPDMREIVEMFVQEMPQRVEQFYAVWESQNLEELRRLAHQMKGASGGYGFGSVGKAAEKLEHSLVSMGHGGVESSLEQLRKEFAELVNICKRVSV